MRLTFLLILLAAAVSALPTRFDMSGVDRRSILLSAPPAARADHAALVSDHVHGRRAGQGFGHRSGLRKVRRLKSKRARKCQPRTSSSTTTPTPTSGDWTQTWSKPDNNSTSGHGSSSSWSDHPGVDGSSSDNWSSSATTTFTTEHGRPSPSSSEESSTASHSSSQSSWGNEETSTSSSTWATESATSSESATESSWDSQSASSTSSSEQPKPTDGGQSNGELDHMLFPNGRGKAFWTTSSGGLSCESLPTSFTHTQVEEALLPLQFGSLPNVGTAPDGAVAFQQVYPGGQYGKGYSFYCGGDKNGVNVEGTREITFAYSVYFADGFAWTKGGKLPGIYGGTSLDAAKTCSGGRSEGRDECFSARVMWRANGDGELYNYFPPDAKNDYCNFPPKSVCNPSFGDSIGRGAFQFKAGQWNTISQRLRLNDPGQKNGEQELFINGQSVIKLNNVMITSNPNAKLYGIMAQTFFGGGSSDFAPPSDQTAWFKDWSLSMS
ncbi:hypothetical protein CcaverHIS641_0305360 [Cutaneotrichosporon cavernicola]|nr:hypothetical protein CcaverHIS641_0305360 [Cutaneotrichosporon cavernicola]